MRIINRILGWFVGLRRPIAHQLSLSGAYRREDRSSNIDRYDYSGSNLYPGKHSYTWDHSNARSDTDLESKSRSDCAR